MDPVLLARIQFGLTVAFHFIFPPVSIGLAWVVAYMGWRYLRTGEEIYDRMTAFWIKIMALIFVVGVATGITMEFQFGTNWSTYSRFVGDIFGSPLAAEGVFAFFLESTFMGILILGKNRVSKGFYWFSSLMVACGATLSAFWIIVANSWQQTPVAYQIVGEGTLRRAELTSFWAAVFNPSTVPRYTHTVVASVLTGGFFVAGISAWYLLKGRHVEFARRSLRIGVVTAAIFSLLVLGAGHAHSVQVAETQPAKMAAFESLFQTTRGASLMLFGVPDPEEQVIHFGVGIPKMLSWLVTFDPEAEVAGLDQFPREEWPPIGVSFQSYHAMIALGMYFIGISWLGVFLLWEGFFLWKRLGEGRYKKLYRLFLWVMVFTLPLPIITMEVGWLAAEFGRQPWVVYGMLKTSEAASVVVPAWQILLTIVLFCAVYALIFGLFLFLVRRILDKGPADVKGKEATAQ